MSQDDARSAAPPGARLPHDLVHRLRNDLGVAIGTADLLLLDRSIAPHALRDLEKIRDACIKTMAEINAAA
jgi:hypothetical protein